MSHRRKDKKKTEEMNPSALLILAEKWAKKLGSRTEIAPASSPDGRTFPVLVILHGDKPVRAVDGNGVIRLSVDLAIEPVIIHEFKKLNKSDQHKFFLQLKMQLLSGNRTGYILRPNGSSFEKVDSIILTQNIGLDEDEIATFNRFADGIQELVSVAVRAINFIGMLKPLPTGSDDSSTTDSTDGMYA